MVWQSVNGHDLGTVLDRWSVGRHGCLEEMPPKGGHGGMILPPAWKLMSTWTAVTGAERSGQNEGDSAAETAEPAEATALMSLAGVNEKLSPPQSIT